MFSLVRKLQLGSLRAKSLNNLEETIDLPTARILGTQWDSELDEFTFELKYPKVKEEIRGCSIPHNFTAWYYNNRICTSQGQSSAFEITLDPETGIASGSDHGSTCTDHRRGNLSLVQRVDALISTNSDYFPQVEWFFSWLRLIRTTAWVQRFARKRRGTKIQKMPMEC
ncbi:unnamed protein product [Allacma fusca]|uniref:Uncharacterized protein n=1 Tax=Allacma fusca TaxID=39272 RepID=A0A8J2L704_9HEXA|nr:unnamed protein product [Allacma fusca]